MINVQLVVVVNTCSTTTALALMHTMSTYHWHDSMTRR